MFNQVILIGRVGSDIAIRQTQSGAPVASISLAVNKQFTDGQGRKVEETLWVRVTCWRKLAEIAAQILHKGDLVQVVGELMQPSVYDGKDGKAHASLEVQGEKLTKLNPKSDSEARTAQPPQAQAQPTQPQPTQPAQPTQPPLTIPTGDETAPF